MATGYCDVGDCARPAKRGGKCWTHSKRLYSGRPLSRAIAESRTPWERVQDAGAALAEAESDAQYTAAKVRLRKAVVAYLEERGWTPPKGK